MRAARRSPCLALFLLLAAAPIFAPAHAGIWDTDTTRLLGDPSYLPLAGQVEGVFGYTYENDRYDTLNEELPKALPSRSQSYIRDSNDFLPELRYGITDDISVFAELGWGNDRVMKAQTFNLIIFPSPPGFHLPLPFRFPQRFERVTLHENFHALGAENPVFGATWRVVDQIHAPVSVDLTGSYTPDIFHARDAGVDRTGTIASGGQSGNVQAAISRETHILTLRAYGGFGYDGRRNIADGRTDLRPDPHAVYTAGLQSELRPLTWLAINAGVNATQAVRFDRQDITGDVDRQVTIEPSGDVSPYAGLVFPLLNQHVAGELLYQHDFIDNEKIISGSDAQRYLHQQANLYTARIYVAFGGTPAPLPAPIASQAPPQAPAFAPARTYLVFFDWDRADLTARARQIVAQAAEASTHTQTTTIEIDGYTDLSGTALYNQRLSIRRAQSVQSELVRDGVNPGEITIHGYGEANPLIQTAKGVREPQNRRVEIILR